MLLDEASRSRSKAASVWPSKETGRPRTKSRNFGSPESILSDVLSVTRPRVPLRFAAQRRSGCRSASPVVGLPRRGLGNLRRGRKSWFPNRHPAARSATASSDECSTCGGTERSNSSTPWHSARSLYGSQNQVCSRASLGLRATGAAVLSEPHHLWPALFEENSSGMTKKVSESACIAREYLCASATSAFILSACVPRRRRQRFIARPEVKPY